MTSKQSVLRHRALNLKKSKNSEIQCIDCNSKYIGQVCKDRKTRFQEHFSYVKYDKEGQYYKRNQRI